MMSEKQTGRAGILLLGIGLLSLCLTPLFQPQRENPTTPQKETTLDPAAWGGDHLNRPLPQFITGDECLFCHRKVVGPSWPDNPHQSTIRRAADSPEIAVLRKQGEEKLAAEVEFVLGRERKVRYLKRAGYGRLAMCSVFFDAENRSVSFDEQKPQWDEHAFGKSCAGCHASGFDGKTERFAAVSLDCFVCHGNVPLEHTKDTQRVLLSKKRADPPRVVISVCGQCHLRGGRSKTTSRPFAHRFVAGDNLFRDFEFDWSDRHLNSMHPFDRHIAHNARDVVLYRNDTFDCRSCHSVHKPSTEKHRELPRSAICAICHELGSDRLRQFPKLRSRVCGY